MKKAGFIKGMMAGALVGSAMGMVAKCIVDKNERQIKRTTDKIFRKAQNALDDLIGR